MFCPLDSAYDEMLRRNVVGVGGEGSGGGGGGRIRERDIVMNHVAWKGNKRGSLYHTMFRNGKIMVRKSSSRRNKVFHHILLTVTNDLASFNHQ